EGDADVDRAVPGRGPRRGGGLPQAGGRPRQVQPGVLQGRRHRRGRRLGQLADRGAVVRLVLPRRAARPRLGERGGRPVGEAQREGVKIRFTTKAQRTQRRPKENEFSSSLVFFV